MSKKKLYRTVITVEVLSDHPYSPETLEQLAYDTTEGDCSGKWAVESSEEVTPERMEKLLKAQESDPAFFDL